MILEYLFSESNKREEITKLKYEKVYLKILDIKNSNLWIVTFSKQGENESNAIILSNINDYVVNHFDCTLLINEAAQYFNKSLFPYINEFEKNLRKLLYIVSNKSNKIEGYERIKELEQMDLGEIFEIIFSDITYIRKTKEIINNKTWQFTKRELINSISSIEEKSLWSKALGNDTAPTLVNNFELIKSYRNDVMHAHNISNDKYNNAKNIFKIVNKEILEAISKILPDNENKFSNLNNILKESINSILTFNLNRNYYSDTIKFALSEFESLKESYKTPIIPLESLKVFQEAMKTPIVSTELLKEYREAIKEPILSTELLKEYREAIKEPIVSTELLKENREAIKEFIVSTELLKENREAIKEPILSTELLKGIQNTSQVIKPSIENQKKITEASEDFGNFTLKNNKDEIQKNSEEE